METRVTKLKTLRKRLERAQTLLECMEKNCRLPMVWWNISTKELGRMIKNSYKLTEEMNESR